MREKIKQLPIIGSTLISISTVRRDLIRSWFDWQLYRKYRKHLFKNKALKNSLKGQTVFILATGPSIKNQDLKVLKGKNCISVSNFFVHPDFKEINPQYHVFAASHDPIIGEQYWAWLRDAEKHFPRGLGVFVSLDDVPVLPGLNVFKEQTVYHYYMSKKSITHFRDLDMTGPVPKTQGVSHLAMYLAMYMGAKKIYLLGCDHDRILHVNQSVHFYEQQQHAMVRKGYNEWSGAGDMQARFKANYELWERYKEIKKYAERHDIEIYNSTPGSLLDVYPRVELSEAIKS